MDSSKLVETCRGFGIEIPPIKESIVNVFKRMKMSLHKSFVSLERGVTHTIYQKLFIDKKALRIIEIKTIEMIWMNYEWLILRIQFFKRDETESHLIEEEVIDLNDLLLDNEESEKNPFEKGTSDEKKSIEILDRVILSTCSNE